MGEIKEKIQWLEFNSRKQVPLGLLSKIKDSVEILLQTDAKRNKLAINLYEKRIPGGRK